MSRLGFWGRFGRVDVRYGIFELFKKLLNDKLIGWELEALLMGMVGIV